MTPAVPNAEAPPVPRSAVTEFACDVAYAGTLSRALGRLQRRVFAAVLRRDAASLRVAGTGAVTARVTGDVEATHAAVAEALGLLLWYLARGVFLLVTMAWLSPRLAFVTLLALPVLLLLPRAVGKVQQVPGWGHGSLVPSPCPLSPLPVTAVPSLHPLSSLSPPLCPPSPPHAHCHLPMPTVTSPCPCHLLVPTVPSTCSLSPPCSHCPHGHCPLLVPAVPSMPPLSPWPLSPPCPCCPLPMPTVTSLCPRHLLCAPCHLPVPTDPSVSPLSPPRAH